jgi:hypothetical protein
VRVTVTSDVDGILHRSDDLVVPQVYEVGVTIPTVAAHVLTVTAVDPDGGEGEATVSVDVNAAPSDPGITIAPDVPIEGDALTATVTTLARDASPLGYAWTWFRDDVPVDSGDGKHAEVPAGTTRALEVWRVSFEAYEKIGDARDPEGGSSFGEAEVTIGVP